MMIDYASCPTALPGMPTRVLKLLPEQARETTLHPDVAELLQDFADGMISCERPVCAVALVAVFDNREYHIGWTYTKQEQSGTYAALRAGVADLAYRLDRWNNQ